MTPAEHHAFISRYQVLMENATDPIDQREAQERWLAAIRARNAERSAGEVEEMERQRWLR